MGLRRACLLLMLLFLWGLHFILPMIFHFKNVVEDNSSSVIKNISLSYVYTQDSEKATAEVEAKGQDTNNNKPTQKVLVQNNPNKPLKPGIDPKVPPTERVMDCAGSGCHAEETSKRYLHGPVAVGACDVCHSYTEVETHKFELAREGQELCAFCHIGRKSGRILHEPVAQGKCLECHNPHGSAARLLSRKDSVGEMCLSCHDELLKDKSVLHTPVLEKDCTGCHKGHFSDYPKLLIEEGRDLCITCHKDLDESLSDYTHVHDPVRDDCTECHDHHGSNYVAHLKESPLKLCTSCHKEIAKSIETASIPHSVVSDNDRACLHCHTPHVSNTGKLLRDQPIKVCLECHDKEIVVGEGYVVADMSHLAKPGQYLHGPAREGNCRGCHKVHGADLRHLLPYPYTEAFYQPFDINNYALCFSCHDSNLVLAASTTEDTNFRNGDKNLHFMHVENTKKGEPGRNCRACHETHSSDRPLHLRDWVPYGQWKLPISFTATETGGTCSAGCHREASYDRLNPVVQDWPEKED